MSSSPRKKTQDIAAGSGRNPFLEWHAAGYRDLLPIIPPDATMKDARRQPQAGKMPGVKRGEVWGGIANWYALEATPEDLHRWHAMGAGVGLIRRSAFLLDIDAYEEEQADLIQREAEQVLGPAPCRVGLWPKRALLYRADGDLSNVGKLRFASAGGTGQIEVPPQAVVAGIHAKTGKPYQWSGLKKFENLTPVSPEQLAGFLEGLRERLPEAVAAGSADRREIDQEALQVDERQAGLLREAVNAIPNRHDEYGYDEWVKLAAALRGAFQDHPEEGEEIFVEWSEKSDLPEMTEDPARVYHSLHPPFAVPPAWIYHQAARHGWNGLARYWIPDDELESAIAEADRRIEADSIWLQADAEPARLLASPYDFPEPSRIPRRAFLYGHHYIRQFVSATVAPPGVGKSSLEIVEALAMASGKALLGIQPAAPCRVWLWNGEDPKDELDRRIAAAMLHFGLTREDVGDRLFVNSGRDTEIVLATETRAGVTIAEPMRESLLRTIRELRLDVVQIDPFISSHQVSENDNGAIDKVTKAWARIADHSGCAVELVHHVRKLNGAEVTVEDSRGAGSLVATARSVRAISRMTRAEASKLGLEEKRKRLFRFGDGKNNLALPADDKTDWMELRSVPLGNGPGDGIEGLMNGDSVGVVCPFTAPEPGAEVAEDERAAALRMLESGEWRKDVRAGDAWAGNAIGAALGLDTSDPEDKAHAKALLSAWLKDGTLTEEPRRDAQRKTRLYVVPRKAGVFD